MMSKIFIGLLAACAVVVAFFTYYSWSWLQSIGMPAAAIEGYVYNDNISWSMLIASAVILLIFGNVILWLTGRAWPLWSTLLFFALFIVIRYFWLDHQFIEFQKANSMWKGGLSAAPLFGAVLVIISAVFVFCDQFAILQLHRTMYPVKTDVELENVARPLEKDGD